MANERLRATLLERGKSVEDLAKALKIDPKTAERWITKGRTPYRRHRYAAASFLEVDETYLWPEALSSDQVTAAAESEIVNVYPHRWAAPRDAWRRLFEQAEQNIDILVYVGLFLADDAGIMRLLREKADAGVRVRVLLGDPDSPHVAQRGTDEGIGDSIVAKVRNAIVLYQPIRDVDGVEIRLHDTTLYNSIYRGDDQLLVNPHVYGSNAAGAPMFHLRRVAGGDMVSMYLESYERVWSEARPLDS